MLGLTFPPSVFTFFMYCFRLVLKFSTGFSPGRGYSVSKLHHCIELVAGDS